MQQSLVKPDVTLEALDGCSCALCSDGYTAEPGRDLAEQAARGTTQYYDTSLSDADQNVDALLTGMKWDGLFLQYSFPDNAFDYSYRGYLNVRDSFQQMNSTQAAAVRVAIDFYESVSGLQIVELVGSADRNADLMFAMSSAPNTAFAYFPHSSDQGGDAWFNTRSYNSPEAGNYAWSTIIHEIGHALGLKHGHETGGPGAIQRTFDSHEYSVMTYRSYVGSPGEAYTNGTWGGPQTAMMLDLSLRHITEPTRPY